jgi:SPP1 gp7 family putative phage head morphogenesis protein
MIRGALEADGRLAAKNAVKIRAALRQVTDFKRVFEKYQETMPQPTDNPTQDRVRARSWIMLNVYINDEPLRLAVTRAWQEAFILGEVAADEWLRKTREANKADDIEVNWDNWKPGDVDTALNIKNFQKYLAKVNADSYFKTFNKETIVNLGTALSDSIELGLDAESAAVMISKHVASPSRALTIAITEQNRAMSFSTIERYKDAGLAKMEWAVSDPCDICAKNDGQVIQIGQSFASGDQQPPAHPHCRCVLLPVIPGMEDDDPMGIDGGLAPMPDGAPVVVEEEPTIAGISEKKLFEASDIYERNTNLPRELQPPGEQRLSAAYQAAGYNDLPQLVDPVEFEAMSAEPNAVKVYRGLGTEEAPKYIQQYKTGEHYAGYGVFGNGTYTSTRFDTARGYAFGDKNIIEIIIPDTTNFVNHKDLKEMGTAVNKQLNAIIKAGEAKAKTEMQAAGFNDWGNPIWRAWIDEATKYDRARAVLGDPGSLATLLGYDGIKIDVEKMNPTDVQEFFYVILNRGKAVIKK